LKTLGESALQKTVVASPNKRTVLFMVVALFLVPLLASALFVTILVAFSIVDKLLFAGELPTWESGNEAALIGTVLLFSLFGIVPGILVFLSTSQNQTIRSGLTWGLYIGSVIKTLVILESLFLLGVVVFAFIHISVFFVGVLLMFLVAVCGLCAGVIVWKIGHAFGLV